MSLKIKTNINSLIVTNNMYQNKILEEKKLKYFLHELLNPLNIINNCAELIDLNQKTCNEKRLTSIILEQVEQCNKLSENVLYDLNSRQINSINICDFLKEIKNKFEILKSININLQLKVECNKIKLKFNQVYLKIILDNILNNAYQHSNIINILLENENNRFKITIENEKKLQNKNGNKSKKSNMVGLELIDTMCNKMKIDWNFLEENNKYMFILYLS